MEPLLLPQAQRGSILYFIWQKPWMCAGNDTFIGDLLRRSGFRNLAPEEGRYPVLNRLEDIQNLKPDFIFLSSEPFPFSDKDLLFFQNNFPDSFVYKVDGGIFSWYGIQTPLLPDYLDSLNLKQIGC
jgi:ABC-type Fe3+-hydroxamate transport system substrate-binding protein